MARPTRFRDKWRIRWTDADGRRQSDVFVDRHEAQLALKQQLLEVEEIKQGRRPRPPAERTFGVLCDQWLCTRAAQKRSSKDDRSIISRHLRPTFGTVLLADLSVEVVERLSASMKHLSAKTRHNVLTLLIAMLNYARDLEWMHRVPRVRKPRVRAFDADYRYLRTRQEIDQFLSAAQDEGRWWRRCTRPRSTPEHVLESSVACVGRTSSSSDD